MIILISEREAGWFAQSSVQRTSAGLYPFGLAGKIMLINDEYTHICRGASGAATIIRIYGRIYELRARKNLELITFYHNALQKLPEGIAQATKMHCASYQNAMRMLKTMEAFVLPQFLMDQTEVLSSYVAKGSFGFSIVDNFLIQLLLHCSVFSIVRSQNISHDLFILFPASNYSDYFDLLKLY